MQKVKAFSGQITFGDSITRVYSYGLSNTNTFYPSKVDFLNQSIADFLTNDCGVPGVAYESRTSNASAKFLWIYNVPFLFANVGTATYFNIYQPLTTSPLFTGKNTAESSAPLYRTYSMIFKSTSDGTYNFSLIFSGNPKSAFALRFIGYGVTEISCNSEFVIATATNLLNNRNSVIWKSNPSYPGSNLTSFYSIDLDEDNNVDIDSQAITSLDSGSIILHTSHTTIESSGGLVPLVPVMVGVRQAHSLYQFPTNAGIPEALSIASLNQTEFSMGNRKFINTVPSTSQTYFLEAGLIDVTGTDNEVSEST